MRLQSYGQEIDGNHDFQLWHHETLTRTLNKKNSLLFESEFRYGGNATTLYHYYFQLRLIRQAAEWLDWGPGYREQRVLRPQERRWVSVHIPFFEGTIKLKEKGWEWLDRNRLRFQMPEDDRQHWLYTNRLMGISAWKWGRMQFNPRIWNEVFFRQYAGFVEDRLGIGGAFPLGKHAQASIYYMRKYLRREKWISQNVLYFFMDFSF